MRIAVAQRVYRVVGVMGPSDNLCGNGSSTSDYDSQTHAWAPTVPYDEDCFDADVSRWLDADPATPIERFYAFAGKQYVYFGSVMYAMERMGFVGEPVNIGDVTAPYGGSHRFYADTQYEPLDNYPEALDLAWDVPQANIDYANTH
jgi:hypothetical protein